MRCRNDDEKDRFRLTAGMGGVVCVTLFLLLAQLQIDSGLLFGA
ncbi:MAG TPA: hypothetical protein VGB08_02305 [Allosphingosinicella sp.]|jgi:hypothetical protein